MRKLFGGLTAGVLLVCGLAVYATLHPDRVRRFVFDGNVDPKDVWAQANDNQDIAFDKNIKIYLDWLAKYDDVYHLGNDGAAIEKTYYRVLDQLRTSPGAGGTIGPDEWTDVFTAAGYYVYGWLDVAEAFSAAVNDNDVSLVKALYDDANVQCDPVPPPDPTQEVGLAASGSGSSRVAPEVTALRKGLLAAGTR